MVSQNKLICSYLMQQLKRPGLEIKGVVFAVVADQLSSLGAKKLSSTLEINTIVQKFQENTMQIVSAMDQDIIFPGVRGICQLSL